MTVPDRRLDVHADLTVEVGGAVATVEGYGGLVVVETATLSAARTLGKRGDSLLDRFVGAEVTVDLRVRGRSVARAGPDHDPGPLSRLLGVAPARLSPGGILLTAIT